MEGRTSKGRFHGNGSYSWNGATNEEFDFKKSIITVPANYSPSGQMEQYCFIRGRRSEQTIRVYYSVRIEGGDWSGIKTLTFK